MKIGESVYRNSGGSSSSQQDNSSSQKEDGDKDAEYESKK